MAERTDKSPVMVASSGKKGGSEDLMENSFITVNSFVLFVMGSNSMC